MDPFTELLAVTLVGLVTTSSSMVGAAIGLYAPLSKRVLACILAFAAGSLISALAIELAFKGAMELHHQGFQCPFGMGIHCRRIRMRRRRVLRHVAVPGKERRCRPAPHAVPRICSRPKARADEGVDRPAFAMRSVAPSSRGSDRTDPAERTEASVERRGGSVSRGGSRRCAVHRRTRIGGSRRGFARRRRERPTRQSPNLDRARHSGRWD